MTVLLHTSNGALPDRYDCCVLLNVDEPTSNLTDKVRDISAELESAFDEILPTWFDLAKSLGRQTSSGLAIAPTCAANISDMGLMLAWSHMITGWASSKEAILVLCDDPWMFRHLAQIKGVAAGRMPKLWPHLLRLALRGYAARSLAAIRFMRASLQTRRQKTVVSTARQWLLVYGHPTSTPDGHDGYFGKLMQSLPELQRILHVDCSPLRAQELSRDGRTFSLHAWGHPLYALMVLPFKRWRAKPTGSAHWLVRRAATREAGTGQPAAVAWQIHCQKRWLENTKPTIISWPWENHGWERSFVRTARKNKTTTVGYQHSVIGRHMLNYAAYSNVDGLESIPDKVLCSGSSTKDQLHSWGLPADRLEIGGALRFLEKGVCQYDDLGPVFVALPSDPVIAQEMVAAVKKISGNTRRFLLKPHPMSPIDIVDTANIEQTEIPLGQHHHVSAVLFAATTVGLEAILLGLPTLRFRSQKSFAIDILPKGMTVDATGPDGLADALNNLRHPHPLRRDKVLATPAMSLWTQVLRKPLDDK